MSKYQPMHAIAVVFLSAVLLVTPGLHTTGFAQSELEESPVSVDKTFKDWRVVCREIGFCSAESRSSDGRLLKLHREAKGDGETVYWSLALEGFADAGKEKDIGLRIDDAAIAQLDWLTGYAMFGGNRVFLTEEKLLMQMLGMLEQGTALAVWIADYVDSSAPPPETASRFSLSGLAASLLFIDDRQKRLKSPRLLEIPEWAERTKETVQALPDEVVAKVRQAQAQATNCNQKKENPEEFGRYHLSGERWLFLFSCNFYAYNSDMRAYVVAAYPGSEPEITPVAVANDAGKISATTLIPSGDFDLRTLRLSGSHKGRGIGDIGDAWSWRWDGYDGFFLVEHFSRHDTNEAIPENADIEWPLVYRYGLKDVSILNGK